MGTHRLQKCNMSKCGGGETYTRETAGKHTCSCLVLKSKRKKLHLKTEQWKDTNNGQGVIKPKKRKLIPRCPNKLQANK